MFSCLQQLADGRLLLSLMFRWQYVVGNVQLATSGGYNRWLTTVWNLHLPICSWLNQVVDNTLAFHWQLTVLLYDTWPDLTARTTVHLTVHMSVTMTVQYSSTTSFHTNFSNNKVCKNYFNLIECILKITRSDGSEQSDGCDRDINCHCPLGSGLRIKLPSYPAASYAKYLIHILTEACSSMAW